jgi:PleD family two-component response regulator
MAYKFKKASVLVVDSMRPMLSLTTSLLKIFGFEKIYSCSGPTERAFEIFCKEKPDIVLTDWYIDDQDGLKLVRLIRTDPASPNPYVPVILMTGYSAEKRVIEARDKGITEFMVKPFTANDLYLRIEQLIEKPRKFVDAENFFGPDRRRKKISDFNGPFRREDEVMAVDIDGGEKIKDEVEEMLNSIRDDVKKV